QPRLVHLVGQLGDDDGDTAGLLVFLDVGAGAHVDAAAPGGVGLGDAARAVDDAGGREIRARDVVHQLADGELGVVDERDAAVDDLAQVVRRNVGRHADGDARAAVDQQVRQAGRQDRGLPLGFVVV